MFTMFAEELLQSNLLKALHLHSESHCKIAYGLLTESNELSSSGCLCKVDSTGSS